MSKAILVIDMPENCTECELCRYDEDYGRYDCILTENEVNNCKQYRPNDCPLIKMPEPKEFDDDFDIVDDFDYVSGYNQALRDIGVLK